ncbi:MAG: hypothetical protein Kow0074_25320 [Candidatus Zixiibacteriota bacterium]
MSTLDLVAIAILTILCIRGAFRGGIAEIIETVGTIGAAIITYLLYPTIAGLVGLPTTGSLVEMLAGFLVVLIGISVVLALLGYWLKRLLHAIRLGTFDRFIGGVLGLIKGAVIVTAIAWCLNWIGVEGRFALDKSPVVKAHLRIATAVWESVTSSDDVPPDVI